MSQTITKHIGEGFARGELYAALAYDPTDQFGGMRIKNIKIAKTLPASVAGLELDIECPLATVGMAWTAALKIDITQTSTLSGAWNVLGRMMGILIDVNVTSELTNAFGIMSRVNLTTSMTSADDVNDIQALVGVVNVNLTTPDTLSGETDSTICGVKGIISRSESGGITIEQNVAAGVFTYNLGGATVSGKSSIVEMYNYGSDTVDAGIYMNPFGTLTVGIELDDADGGVFTTGISIDACTTAAITISGAQTIGLNITGTLAAATARAIKSNTTINNCNLTDGVGTNEFQLSITGTGAGHIATTSSWLNIPSGTHGAGGNWLTPLTVGVWEAGGATINGSSITFGMHMQSHVTDTDAARLCPFSVNVSGDTIDAIWNAASPSHLGYAASTNDGESGIMPFVIDSNGRVWYIRLYDS